MSSINLVKQLKGKRSGARSGTIPGTAGGGLKGFFQNLSASTDS